MRIAQAAAAYDLDVCLQIKSRDEWEQAKFESQTDDDPALVAGPDLVLTPGKGPWGIGDSFWPFAEQTLAQYLDQNTSQGGTRQIAQQVFTSQNADLVVTEDAARQFCRLCVPTPTRGYTCSQVHPGLCQEGHADIFNLVKTVVGRLHSIRWSVSQSVRQ